MLTKCLYFFKFKYHVFVNKLKNTLSNIYYNTKNTKYESTNFKCTIKPNVNYNLFVSGTTAVKCFTEFKYYSQYVNKSIKFS